MKNIFLAPFIFAAVWIPCSAPATGRSVGWAPEKTWLFVVGTLNWKHSDQFGSFPVEQRRDAELVDLFKKRGVPETQIVYLQDKQATRKRIDEAFAAHLKKLSADDLLIVYYCGHGSKSPKGDDVYLASYDAGDDGVSGWSVNSIPRAIDALCHCRRVLWFMDCCYSGQAAIALAKKKSGPAYGCVTSSSASESSTGHWTFTQALLDALNGAAYVDLNHDGSITLAEFAGHVEKDMSIAEEQLSTFAATEGFDKQMILAQAQPLSQSRIGERAKLQWHGDWYPVRVIETRGDQLKVHYIGYDDDEDTWVRPDQLSPIKLIQYPVGTNVEVQWKKKWYPAMVLKVKESIHFIHYRDYDSNWDEWVASKRIRNPKS
jgi:hypothetical protein